ncbi:MAG: glycosyltransferase family 4 protein [Verrucomicrobia bacterium]|nr:glycosyltransferase family 4 protein [Verrucomicrobiota bacterium]
MPPKNVKILALTNLFPPHHAGTFDFRCQTITEALQKRGHEVRVLTSNHGMNTEQRDQDIERRLRLNGVYGHPSLKTYFELAALEKANHQVLRETLATFEPDLVHVFSLEGLPKSFIFALRHSQLPTVYDVADYWIAAGLRRDRWLRWWNRKPAPLLAGLGRACLELIGQRRRFEETAPTRMMAGYDRLPTVYGSPEFIAKVEPNSIGGFRFDRIYFCSQMLKERTEAVGFQVRHGEVIYPGIRTERFVADVKPQSASITKFLIVSSLEVECGVMTALQALLKARENNVRATLSICGRGESEYIAQLRSFVIRHQLPVEFLTLSNWHEDLPKVYRAHDAFIYPAEWHEPFAVTPLEAMAAGLPVIAAKSGGACELFRNGDNAWVFTPGDALELASRIQELQMQPVLRCQIADRAQQQVLAKFNESTVVDQIENFLTTSLEFWNAN